MQCFAKSLGEKITDRRAHFNLSRKVFVELAFPFAASFVAAAFLYCTNAPLPADSKELVFLNVLKLASIFVLGRHTQAAAEEIPGTKTDNTQFESKPVKIYGYVGQYMFLMGIILAVHTALLLIATVPEEYTKSWYVLYVVTVLPFLYMPFFWWGNREFIKSNPENMGVARFAEAFIYGVNIPFIFAFIVILAVSVLSIFMKNVVSSTETFLVGAVAFLIYSSTLASICMDYYARPFLGAGSGDCHQ